MRKIAYVCCVIGTILLFNGCADQSAAVKGNDSQTETQQTTDRKENDIEPQTDETSESQSVQETAAGDEENLIYYGAVLTREIQADKICIAVQPSVLRTYVEYYYVPDDGDQEQLRQLMAAQSFGGEPSTGRWKGMKETGWRMVCQDQWYRAFEGGYLTYTNMDENGQFTEYLIEAPELCAYIQTMLQVKMNYMPFDPADIKNIVSAKLEVRCMSTHGEFYSQTITDRETLELFEDWFSNAKYICGGADCGNQQACLQLQLASGETVCLSIATDSCPDFGINGVYYDYRPTTVWDNQEFFKQFDEIPWDRDY